MSEEPTLFPGYTPTAMHGRQWQNLPMPRRSRELPAGHTVSISTDSRHVPGILRHGYTPELEHNDKGDARRETEHFMFGTPTYEGTNNRHVYGYLRPNNVPSPIGQYGNVNLNVRPSALRGATTTPADSVFMLRDAHSPNPVPEPLGPQHTSTGHYVPRTESLGDDSSPDTVVRYREVQIPGGTLKPHNIESADVVSHVGHDDPEYKAVMYAQRELRANQLRRQGIPTTHSTRMYQPSLFESSPYLSHKGQWLDGEVLSSGLTPTSASEEEDLRKMNDAQQRYVSKHGETTNMPNMDTLS